MRDTTATKRSGAVSEELSYPTSLGIIPRTVGVWVCIPRQILTTTLRRTAIGVQLGGHCGTATAGPPGTGEGRDSTFQGVAESVTSGTSALATSAVVGSNDGKMNNYWKRWTVECYQSPTRSNGERVSSSIPSAQSSAVWIRATFSLGAYATYVRK